MSEFVEQVEVEWASSVNGHARGDREVLARTPDLENLIEQRHVRVMRVIPAPTPPAPDIADEHATETDPEPAPTRRGRKTSEETGGEG